MRLTSTSLLSGCVLFSVLLLAGGEPISAYAARIAADHFHLTQPSAVQPAGSAYAIQNFTYANCDSALPLQLDDVTLTVLQHDVYMLLVRFTTAVAIPSSYWLENITVTPAAGGDSSVVSLAGGLESVLVPPATLPIAAGATSLLSSLSWPHNRALGHYEEHVRFYDAQQRMIGCSSDSYNLVQV